MTLLDKPLRLRCGVTLANRMGKAALTEGLCNPSREEGNDTLGGSPSQELIDLYAAWGKPSSKLGLCISGNVMIDRRFCEAPRNAVLEDERHLTQYKRYATSMKFGHPRSARGPGENHECVGLLQISHPGRQCPASVTRQPVGASAVAVALPGPKFASNFLVNKPRALTTQEVSDVVGRFATTAQLAVKAGFDGVEVHAAHGYLLNQFLSPKVNSQRSDKYDGNSPENRRRLLLEVLSAVRTAVGPNKVVGVKLNSSDFQKGGSTEDDNVAVLEAIESLKVVDFIEISGGTYENPKLLAKQRDTTKEREAFFLEFCTLARKVVKDTPLMLTGGFRSPQAMEAALASGNVDIIGAGRPYCIDPAFAAHAIDTVLNGCEKTKSLPVVRYSVPVVPIMKAITEPLIENLWHQAQMHSIAVSKVTSSSSRHQPVSVNPYPLLGMPTIRVYYWDPKKFPSHTRRVLVSLLALCVATGCLFFEVLYVALCVVAGCLFVQLT